MGAGGSGCEIASPRDNSGSKDLKSVCQIKVEVVTHKVRMARLCLGCEEGRNDAFNRNWEFRVSLKESCNSGGKGECEMLNIASGQYSIFLWKGAFSATENKL